MLSKNTEGQVTLRIVAIHIHNHSHIDMFQEYQENQEEPIAAIARD